MADGLALSGDEIDKRFGKHPAAIEGPNPNEAAHAELRREFILFTEKLSVQLAKPTREAALAFTALEEASMWAHKAIAQLPTEEAEEGEI
jgi:hypothetical protein